MRDPTCFARTCCRPTAPSRRFSPTLPSSVPSLPPTPLGGESLPSAPATPGRPASSRPSPLLSPYVRLLTRGPLQATGSSPVSSTPSSAPIACSLLSDANLVFYLTVRQYAGFYRVYCGQGSVEPAIEVLNLMAARGSVPHVFFYGSLIHSGRRLRSGGADAAGTGRGGLEHAGHRFREGRERTEEVAVEMDRRGAAAGGTCKALIYDGISDR